MFWNRKKNTQASGHANDEAVQRPRVAQATTISMGNAPGVWVKTTGNTDVNPRRPRCNERTSSPR